MGFWKSLFGGEYVNPRCVERSAYAAMAYRMQKHLPTRIIISRFTGKPWTDHAQAQVFLDGKWEWLQVGGNNAGVSVGREDIFGRDYGQKQHYKMLTIKQLMDELDEKGLLDNDRLTPFKIMRDINKPPEGFVP